MAKPAASEKPRGTRPIHHYVLVGWPLVGSLSPAIHRVGFAELGIDADYVLRRTRPDRLREAVEAVRSGELSGANVTVPHKEAVRRLVDTESDTVRMVHAANTLTRTRDGVRADNTDVPGFESALHALWPEGHEAGAAVIMGAGGAARSVAHFLLGQGWTVDLVARRREEALTAAGWLSTVHGSGRVSASRLSDDYLTAAAERASLLVNATPVGAAPDTGGCLWPTGSRVPPSAGVIDIVAWPIETRLVALARESGARAIGGLPMLVAQAALSVELWTGRTAPRESMLAAALEAADEARATAGTRSGKAKKARGQCFAS